MLSGTQTWIVNYLKGKEGWTSPTQIGDSYRFGHHSAWASPKCRALVKMGILERNDRGWYRIKKDYGEFSCKTALHECLDVLAEGLPQEGVKYIEKRIKTVLAKLGKNHV